MGEEGFSSDSSLLYHRNIPSTIARRPRVGAARPVDHAEPPADAAAPQAARPVRRRGRRGRRRRDRPPARPRQRRRAHLVCRGRRAEPAGTATGSATSASTSSAARRASRRCSARFDVGAGRLRRHPAGDDAPLAARASPTASRCAPTASRPTRHIAPPKRYLSASTASCSSTRRTASATCACPAGPLLAEDVGAAADDDRGLHQAPRATGPGGVVGTVHTCPFHPLDVVGWDGCLYPYVFNVARLRADHRPGPPAAAGAPGVRGLELRHLQLRAAQGRLPPAVDPGALLPLQRRQRRDHVLRRRRLRGAQGLRHRQGLDLACTPAATRTGRSPARTRRSIGVEYFDELAVMVDTFRPLELGEAGRAVDDGQYAWSWVGRAHRALTADPAPAADTTRSPSGRPSRSAGG